IESTIPIFAAMIRETPGSVASVVIDDGSWEDIGDIPGYGRIRAGAPGLRYEGATHELIFRVAESETFPIPPISGSSLEAAHSAAGQKMAADVTSTLRLPVLKDLSAVAEEEEAFIRQTLGLDSTTRVEMAPVGKGGSDRSYFRVSAPAVRPVILMRYGRMYEENDLYAAVASFLRGIGVTVPTIYGHDPEQRLILMEDLGDRDLYALRDAPWEVRRDLYEKTLAQAATMISVSPNHLPAGLRLMPGFDEALYRWERNYFREHCVRNVCRIDLFAAEDEALEAELAALAGRLLATPTVLVHRDLQSQNVMICDGEPVLIDFQGIRPGSLFYDLASLLCDPYVSFPEAGRENLLLYYHEISGAPYDWDAFRELFLLASAQRLMQALGAYGFLGLKREKPHFLAHIRPALDNLITVTAAAGSLPHLHTLARRCRKI
ncbi:MAG: phosphotransferase, partial [Deltaproteobacteria bacterium]